MGLCVWICVLYSLLQAGVLSQTLPCPPRSGRGCVQGLTTNDADQQYADNMEHRDPACYLVPRDTHWLDHSQIGRKRTTSS
ncbi:unnamed protein product [Boreogadus saida]